MTQRRRISLAVSGVCAVGAAVLAASVAAGPENIRFPEDFDKGVMYATVDRYDIKQYRELWSTPAGVKAVREGKPITSGTVLTVVQYAAKQDDKGNLVKDANGRFVKGDLVGFGVMEKRTGWGADYAAEVRNGEWEYQVFGADGKTNDKVKLATCFQCHKPRAANDFLFTWDRLKAFAAK